MPVVETVGEPGFQPLPSSMTMEPSGVRNWVRPVAKLASHLAKASPERLPYFFFRTSGKGGEVKTICTRPRQASRADEASASSVRPMKSRPAAVR